MLHSPVKTVCSCRPLPFSIPGREQSGANPPQSRINPGFFKTFRTLPQQHLFNEFMAKDTSRKSKAAFRAKFLNGERVNSMAPFGYVKHPDIKNKLMVDEETAWIVRKIFDLAFHGMGANRISKVLMDEKIPSSRLVPVHPQRRLRPLL